MLIRRTHPSEVANGSGRFEVSVVFPDGNPRLLSRHTRLVEALAHEEEQRRARKGQTCCVFVTDRDNEERGTLSDLDLDTYGEAL